MGKIYTTTRKWVLKPWFQDFETLRKLLEDYSDAADLGLSIQDTYVITGTANPAYDVDQAIYDYLHSDNPISHADLKRDRFRARTVRCKLLVAPVLMLPGYISHPDGRVSGWVDNDGWYWPSDHLPLDRGDRSVLVEHAVDRWKELLDSGPDEDSNFNFLHEVVGYCWQGGKVRQMRIVELQDLVPAKLIPSSWTGYSCSDSSQQSIESEEDER